MLSGLVEDLPSISIALGKVVDPATFEGQKAGAILSVKQKQYGKTYYGKSDKAANTKSEII
jgi:hypothetical protein